MQEHTIPQPNFVRKILEMQDAGAFPKAIGVHLVTVYHDDWCGIYQQPPRVCDCDPDIRLKVTVPGPSN